MEVTIRTIGSSDEARWRALWEGYCRFYEVEIPAAVTNRTWQRIMDPQVPVYAIVAQSARDGVIGFANFVVHENTWTPTPVCYLEDLYVDRVHRGGGVGRQLIDWLVGEMRVRGWSRLYWNTHENNYRARGLYDKYTARDGFVRYVMANAEATPAG